MLVAPTIGAKGPLSHSVRCCIWAEAPRIPGLSPQGSMARRAGVGIMGPDTGPTGDAMDAAEVVRGVWEGMEARDWDRVRSLLDDGLVVDWPQTRERIRGGDAYVALNRAYPGDWHIEVVDCFAAGSRAALRAVITDGPAIFLASGFYRVADGRIAEAVELFAEPTEPPYDRSQWTERY